MGNDISVVELRSMNNDQIQRFAALVNEPENTLANMSDDPVRIETYPGRGDPTRKKEKPMSEKLTIANPEDGNRPLSYQALSHGIDELRLGDMGITDAVWRGPHSELVALARRILDAEAGR